MSSMNVSEELKKGMTDSIAVAGPRFVRIPVSGRRRFPILTLGVGAYASALAMMWITGLVIFSGAVAAVGALLIVVGLHVEEKVR